MEKPPEHQVEKYHPEQTPWEQKHGCILLIPSEAFRGRSDDRASDRRKYIVKERKTHSTQFRNKTSCFRAHADW